MGASVRPDDPGRIQRNIAAMRSQGADEKDIEAYLTQHEGLKPEMTSSAPRSTLYNAINNVSNNLTAGLGQKFNAAFNAAGDAIRGKDSFTHSYDANLEAEHQGLDEFRRNHPIASALTGAAGGVGQIALAAPLAAAGELQTGLSAAARAGAAAKTGFGLGATAALGNAPNEGGLLKNTLRAAMGGGAGAAIGAAAVPLSEGVAAASGKLGRIGNTSSRVLAGDPLSAPAATTITPRAAEIASESAGAADAALRLDPASRLLLQRLQRAGLTPGDALARLEAVPAEKPVTVMEIAGDKSHPVRQLGKLVARTQSGGSAQLRADIGARAEPLLSANRVLGDVGEAMGVQRTNLAEHAEKMAGQRLAAAKPHYDIADQAQPVPLTLASEQGTTLADLMKRPSIKNALNFHNEVAAERGEAPLSLGGEGEDALDAVPLKTLQQIKFKLDEMLGFAKERGQLPDGTAATKAKLNAINDTRLSLLDIMGKHSPEYAQGNDVWAGESALQSANKQGRDFLRAPFDELQSGFPRLTQGEQEQHNIGALSGPVRDKLFKTNAVDRAKILNGPDMQERLQVVVPPDRLPVLRRNVDTEHQMALTTQSVFGGSDTFENAQNAFDASNHAEEAAVTALTHGPKKAAAELFQKLLESKLAARLQGVNEATADALAPRLTAGVHSRLDLQKMLDDLALRHALQQTMRPSPPLAGAASGVTFGRVGRQ